MPSVSAAELLYRWKQALRQASRNVNHQLAVNGQLPEPAPNPAHRPLGD